MDIWEFVIEDVGPLPITFQKNKRIRGLKKFHFLKGKVKGILVIGDLIRRYELGGHGDLWIYGNL